MGKSLGRFARIAAVCCALQIQAAGRALADDAVEPDAAKVLAAMADYLSALQSFSVEYDVEVDVVSFEAEKLAFSSSGDVTVQRPDRLHATRKGARADAEIFLDGKNLTILGRKLNGYVQLPAGSIDTAIEAIRSELDFDAPAADFLASRPFAQVDTDVVSGRHVGMAYVDGVAVHHLAFRGNQVDWQLWVQDGDRPLPLKYVITSKWVTGAPEYTLRLRSWNVAPQVDAALFNFTPPAGAAQLTDVSVGETGELVAEGE
jgi:hypothetical protein